MTGSRVVHWLGEPILQIDKKGKAHPMVDAENLGDAVAWLVNSVKTLRAMLGCEKLLDGAIMEEPYGDPDTVPERTGTIVVPVKWTAYGTKIDVALPPESVEALRVSVNGVAASFEVADPSNNTQPEVGQ